MDWSALPPELLHLISKRFHKISDLIHFRGVCATWRTSASISHLPPQIPCFLTPTDSGCRTLYFFSLNSDNTQIVDVPLCCDETILGSSNGFLLTRRSQYSENLYLYNPVSYSKISLPSLNFKRPELVWASSDPIQTDDYAVCVGNSCTPVKLTAFWRHGEMKWTTINNCAQRTCYIEGKGKYLGLSAISKVTWIYDVAANTLSDMVPPAPGEGPCSPPGALVFLVASVGQILRVVEHYDKYLHVEQCQFDIYKLDFEAKQEMPFRWVKISSIGDQILFLNVCNGFSISENLVEGFRGNSIYFFKEIDTGASFGESRYVLSRYDIEAGTAERLPFPCVTGGTWFQRSMVCVAP